MYSDFEIRQLHLSIRTYRQMVERFLADNGLRLDDVDYYAGVFRCGEEELLAGGGLAGGTIKCIAVSPLLRDEGISNRLVSHLISRAAEQGFSTVRVFTKPENRTIFESLSFRLLAEAPKAILMETGRGLEEYCQYLGNYSGNEELFSRSGERGTRSEDSEQAIHAAKNTATTNLAHRSSLPAPRKTRGIIVMNGNPFTRGHRYLIERAAAQVSHLFIICVRENRSTFQYEERLRMMQEGCRDIANATVLQGSDYAISAATFPTYFLKQLTDASDMQMMLDLDLFRRHIAPALGTTIRFVGTEPSDPLTRRYNELMHEMLPQSGIEVCETERLKEGETIVSASLVRKHLADGSLQKAAPLVPHTTLPYLIAHLAAQALQQELDTTPKPGLVDRHDNGAHTDMDYALMSESIRALRPYFVQLAELGFQSELPPTDDIRRIGTSAESAMLHATHGVNTHKGALFSMGLTIVAAAHEAYKQPLDISPKALQQDIITLAKGFNPPTGTHGSMVNSRQKVKGALANAQAGYAELYADWLPFMQSQAADGHALHKTLLHIMTQLDDTNIYFRRDAATVARVKEEAKAILSDFSEAALSDMNRRFVAENISPGGSADMLALTVFNHSILS